MLYRIGEVSKLFGLTNETLRNYERANIIRSRRVEGSRYRFFDIENISKLIGIRARRNEGFSMQELEKIYHDASMEEYCQFMEDKMRKQEAELALGQLRLKKLQQINTFLSTVRNRPNACELVEGPTLYLLPYRDGDELNASIPVAQMSQWAKNMMFVTNYVRYTTHGTLPLNPRYEMALAATQDVVNALNLDLTPPVYSVHTGLCVRCYCERPTISKPWEQAKPHIEAFLSEHHLTLSGDPFTLTLCGFHERQVKRIFTELYLPVGQKG